MLAWLPRSVMLAGVTFANFNGTAAPLHVGHPTGNASASLSDCSFLDSSLTPSPAASGLLTAWGPATVRMHFCSAVDCTADWTVRQVGTGSARVYADAMPIPSSAASVGGVQRGSAEALAASELDGTLLSAGDEWILQTREVSLPPPCWQRNCEQAVTVCGLLAPKTSFRRSFVSSAAQRPASAARVCQCS